MGARLKWTLAALAVALAAYGYYAGTRLQLETAPAPMQLRQRVLYVTTPTKTYELIVEVAETPEQQARGLMYRTELAENRGMVFLFPRATDAGFWMKNTKIPLSIAFSTRTGGSCASCRWTPAPCRPRSRTAAPSTRRARPTWGRWR